METEETAVAEQTETQEEAPAKVRRPDPFYEDIKIPINADFRENGFEPVNPVDVEDKFVLAPSLAANLAERIERGAELLGGFEDLIIEKERKLARLRRTILADHWSGGKTANAELIEQFILASADTAQKQELIALEDDLADLELKKRKTARTLGKLRERLKLLERNLDWMREYLWAERHSEKVKGQAYGRR
jgi:hypothetical protein